jgi:ubiquinone biosynthesis protein Coq4
MIPSVTQLKNFKITGGIIWLLELIHGKDYLAPKQNHLRTLQRGTVGREVAELLDRKQYRLIPKFENHDLKHIVLEYEMTMEDEIKMQAYLIGNSNFTLPCLLFFSLGIFYPGTWKDLVREYRNGKISKSIHLLTLDSCMEKQLKDIKTEYGRKKRNIHYEAHS